MLKIGCRDQYPRTRQWAEVGVRGLSESQDKFVGTLNWIEQSLSPLDVSPPEAVWDITRKQNS